MLGQDTGFTRIVNSALQISKLLKTNPIIFEVVQKKINNDNFFLYKGNIFHKRYVGSSNEFKNKSIFLLVNLSNLQEILT